jgi:ATP-dependent DNA ligase
MKPMLCRKLAYEHAKSKVHPGNFYVLEQKYDGVRAYIEDGKLYDRREQEITKKFPEFEGLEKLKGTFDGEIIAQNGQFNDVSGRMHMKDKFQISLIAKKNPAKLIVFDMPSVRGNLEQRRDVLCSVVLPQWATVAEQHEATEAKFEELWNKVIEDTAEGLVMKYTLGDYEFGKRSDNWYKIKAFVETIALFTKYEVTPRGLTIETPDGRRVVVNGEQAVAVQKAIDNNGEAACEIQFLPQLDSEAWRFPSFRGLRGIK